MDSTGRSTLLVAAACAALALGCRSERGPAPPESSEILWDSWGVPHVYGETVEDLGRGFGWAQMHSHGNAILRLYGMARGRAAEYWGERYVASDRLVHALGIPQAGRAAYQAQSSGFRRYLDAFAEGMNAYAREHPDAIAEEVRAVLPVDAADALAHGQRMLFTFAAITGDREPLVGIDGGPTRGPSGSNTWAIGPERSASGNALLLQNPHLPWTVDLMRFYEAQLVGPGLNVYGATLIGAPVIAIGFNRVLGWSHTVNTIDVLDHYRLELAGDGYRFDGTTRAFETERRTLRVQGGDGRVREMPLVLRRSVHGPVVRMDDSSAVAVRTPLFERHGAWEQWWDMGRARNLDGFESALRRLQIPMFTVSYADRDGHILYLFNGTVPRRPFGGFETWQTPVRGDTSATLWTDIHAYDELPRLLDPEPGFIQNSNSPPWFATFASPLDGGDHPAYLAPEGLNFRELRGLRMLTSDSSITFDELLSMRYSSRMLLADRLLDELLPAARAAGGTAAEGAAVLKAWDREADADSRGAVLFATWAREWCRAAQSAARCGFERPWDPDAALATPVGLADPDEAAALLERVATSVRQRYGALDVPWGDVHRLGADLDLPGTGAPGDPLGVFHVVGYAPVDDGRFRAVQGDTYVAVIEFTPDGPRAQALLSYGNASQPGSAHAGDQLELLSREAMRPVWFTRAEVEANLERRTPIAEAAGAVSSAAGDRPDARPD